VWATCSRPPRARLAVPVDLERVQPSLELVGRRLFLLQRGFGRDSARGRPAPRLALQRRDLFAQRLELLLLLIRRGQQRLEARRLAGREEVHDGVLAPPQDTPFVSVHRHQGRGRVEDEHAAAHDDR
jgi:hypothetical protein